MEYGKIISASVHRQEGHEVPPLEHSVVEIAMINKPENSFRSLLYHLKGDVSADDLESLRNNVSHPAFQGHFMFMGEVESFDKKKKIIYLVNGNTISYRHLIVASGIRHEMGGEEFSAAMKALVDALSVQKVPSTFPKELLGDLVQKAQRRSSVATKQESSHAMESIVQGHMQSDDERAPSGSLSYGMRFDLHL